MRVFIRRNSFEFLISGFSLGRAASRAPKRFSAEKLNRMSIVSVRLMNW